MPPQRTTRRALTVVGLILTLAMGALEATVVSTVMPTVVGDLGGIHHYAWVAVAYMISSSVSVPIFGKLSDVYGRKPIILLGMSVFLLGSALSGASRSMMQLIVFRALQGLGAGAMQPMALTIVGDIFDLEERSRMQGVFGAAWGVFGLIGPLVGGLIVHYFSWRWVFYVNLPFGAAAAAILVVALHERIDKQRRELDFLGAALLSGAIVSLLLASRQLGGGATYAVAALSAALFAAFFAAERRAAEPVIPLSLFSRPSIALASLAGAILGGVMMGTLTYVPLLVQGVMHGTVTDAGTASTPMVVGWPIASAVSGRLIPKLGFRPLIRLGFAITAASALVLALTAQGDSLMQLRATTLAFGTGMGLANTALLISVQTSVAWDQRGIATASTIFVRTLGGAVAVGVMGGVLTRALEGDPTLPADAGSRILSPEGARGVDADLLSRFGNALAGGLDAIFWIIAAMAMAGFLITLWFPKMPVDAVGAGPAR